MINVRCWLLLVTCLVLSACGKSQPNPAAPKTGPDEAQPNAQTATSQAASDSATAVETLPPDPSAKNASAAGTTVAETDEKPAADAHLEIEGLLRQARAHADETRFAEALQAIEQVLQQQPTHRLALLLHAHLLNERAFQLIEGQERRRGYQSFGAAAETMRRLVSNYEDLTDSEKQALFDALYNEACMHAVFEKPEQGLAALAEALAAGFGNLEQLESDDDLVSVRKLPQFEAMMAEHLQRVFAAELASFETFPFDFRLQDLDGQPIALADFKDQVLIVDLWGTWCPPCRREIPHFIKLKEKLGPAGLEVVGLNFERVPAEDAVTVVRAFHKRNELNYRCAIGTDEVFDKVPNAEAFPTTLFIDRSGTVRLKIVGYHSFWSLDAISRLLLEESLQKGVTGADPG